MEGGEDGKVQQQNNRRVGGGEGGRKEERTERRELVTCMLPRGVTQSQQREEHQEDQRPRGDRWHQK